MSSNITHYMSNDSQATQHYMKVREDKYSSQPLLMVMGSTKSFLGVFLYTVMGFW